ncbi:glycogenin glucosyltransferase [Blastocladiella emersonii ATCC 22665]|nr:glycogenin glucosyltransferase [Blastocladiella emersonii ATCC 22665]
MSNFAYATLVTSDSYVVGASVLAQSLRASGTPHRLVVLHWPELTPESVDLLRATFDDVVPIAPLRSTDHANLQLLGRPELDVTYSKLHVWNLVQFAKIVFIDADAFVLTNVDELFDRDELSAAPDCGWPDTFNSGVFVLQPNKETFDRLVAFAASHGSWDGGDQGLLNDFFSDWNTAPGRRLPFTYNVTPSAAYTSSPAFQRFENDIKVVHFAGSDKPWTYARNTDGSAIGKGAAATGSTLLQLVNRWWAVYTDFAAKYGHLLNPFTRTARSASGAAGAHSAAGHGGAHHHHVGGQPGAQFGLGGGNPFADMNSSRYAWPEDEMDANEIEVWKRAMTGSGRRRESFRRRRSFVAATTAPTTPTSSTIVTDTKALLATPTSPISPTYTNLAGNFSSRPVSPATSLPPASPLPVGASPIHFGHSASFADEMASVPVTEIAPLESPMSFADSALFGAQEVTKVTTSAVTSASATATATSKWATASSASTTTATATAAAPAPVASRAVPIKDDAAVADELPEIKTTAAIETTTHSDDDEETEPVWYSRQPSEHVISAEPITTVTVTVTATAVPAPRTPRCDSASPVPSTPLTPEGVKCTAGAATVIAEEAGDNEFVAAESEVAASSESEHGTAAATDTEPADASDADDDVISDDGLDETMVAKPLLLDETMKAAPVPVSRSVPAPAPAPAVAVEEEEQKPFAAMLASTPAPRAASPVFEKPAPRSVSPVSESPAVPRSVSPVFDSPAVSRSASPTKTAAPPAPAAAMAFTKVIPPVIAAAAITVGYFVLYG